jgi:hypothetical protein
VSLDNVRYRQSLSFAFRAVRRLWIRFNLHRGDASDCRSLEAATAATRGVNLEIALK